MSLEYAILGFLQYKPMSGYDMKKMVDNSISHFWSADQSLIYRTLANLTKNSLVEVEVVFQDSRPNSKVYYITDSGREKFRKWLNSPIERMDVRVSWLIQLFFANELSDEKIIKLLTGFLDQLENSVASYANYAKSDMEDDHISKRDKFFKTLTLDYGEMVNKSIQNWIESTIEKIKNKEWEI